MKNMIKIFFQFVIFSILGLVSLNQELKFLVNFLAHGSVESVTFEIKNMIFFGYHALTLHILFLLLSLYLTYLAWHYLKKILKI